MDLMAFERFAAGAREARLSGDLPVACDLFADALGLWRGEPLADIEVLLAHPAVIGLGRRWAAIVEEFADAAAMAGLHDRVLPHLRVLAGREPLNERAHARLMVALTGSGHQAAALRVYEDLRRRLEEQLDVLPCAELAEAHARVLRGEIPVAGTPTSGSAAGMTSGSTAPVASSGAAAPAAVPPVVPRQLPGATRHFTGRAGELAALTGMLGQVAESGQMVLAWGCDPPRPPAVPAWGGDPPRPPAVVISAIGGMAGIGKTALAVHWAHQVAGRFPDGQLYVNLRGFDPSGSPMTATDALRGFFDAFAVPVGQIPVSLDARAALYRSLVADKRVLVVLDNARDADQVRPLLPGNPACLVILTSRSQLTSLVAAEGARPLALDLLPDADASDLLTRLLGHTRVTAEPEAVTELIQLCARLPLALSIAAARATARPLLPLAALAAELRDARGRLDTLSTGDAVTDVRAVFSWSYQHLSAPAARMFRLLGVHPGPDISVPAAASLAAIRPEQARTALAELTRAHVLTEHAAGRFAFHDLLRTYAGEQATTHDSYEERRSAVHRMLDHYLHAALSAARLLYPAWKPPALASAQPGVTPEDIAGDERALEWCQSEHAVLLAAITLAAETGFDVHAWQLPWTLVTFLNRRGHWHDLIATQRTALAAARRLGDLNAQAFACRGVGRALALLGSHDDASTQLLEALGLFGRLGDEVGQGNTHLDLGQTAERQGRYRDALDHCVQALGLYQRAGYLTGQANALNNIGWFHAMLGDHKQGLACCEQALDLHRERGDRTGEATALDSLGYAHHHLGDHARALACYQRALGLHRESGDRFYQADTLTHLGDTHYAAGDSRDAADAWQRALTILDDLSHPAADGVRAKLLRGRSSPSHGERAH